MLENGHDTNITDRMGRVVGEKRVARVKQTAASISVKKTIEEKKTRQEPMKPGFFLEIHGRFFQNNRKSKVKITVKKSTFRFFTLVKLNMALDKV